MKSLFSKIEHLANTSGFQQIGISDIDLSLYENRLNQWLAKNFHGEMDYMKKHGAKRSNPGELIPGTLSIISVRMNYLPPDARMIQTLRDRRKGYIARYALGRDYHKVLKSRLKILAVKIQEMLDAPDQQQFSYRVFVDSAPVLEKPIAEKAGLGWIGKNTLLLNASAGSYFFLGEIYTNIPIEAFHQTHAAPLVKSHCGSCSACMDVCPTKAIVAPYQLDARKCISYLTIEYKKSIPIELRPLMGNRIFGCDDCQIVCPWNRFAQFTQEPEFHPRHTLDHQDLIDLFAWSEETFLKKTEGSPIRRTGYECWLRNIAVALGNAPQLPEVIAALRSRLNHPSELVREHVMWALEHKRSLKQNIG